MSLTPRKGTINHIHVCACVCVSVYVTKRERGRERESADMCIRVRRPSLVYINSLQSGSFKCHFRRWVVKWVPEGSCVQELKTKETPEARHPSLSHSEPRVHRGFPKTKKTKSVIKLSFPYFYFQQSYKQRNVKGREREKNYVSFLNITTIKILVQYVRSDDRI